MSCSASKTRSFRVDMLRGIAMLLVVLDHTVSGLTLGYENTFVFEVIWSLQIPLFMLISGYVTRYGKPIASADAFFKAVGKKTLAYLLPWLVWTFIVRGVVMGHHNFFDLRHLLWHMDSGYWFMFSIWMIALAYILSDYLASKLNRCGKPLIKELLKLAFYLLCMALYGLIAVICGIGFLGLKLTLYYMPFYYAGSLYGKYADVLAGFKWYKTAEHTAVAVSFAAWLAVLVRCNIFSLGETPRDIVIRAASSLLGCIAVCGLVGTVPELPNRKVSKVLTWFGCHSLQVYLLHNLVLNIIKLSENPQFATPQGIALCAGNYLITLGIVYAITRLCEGNRVLQFVLFGKKANRAIDEKRSEESK